MASLNDAHIHLGKISGINQYLLPEELLKIKERMSWLGKVLVMAGDVEPLKDNAFVADLAHTHDWIYGLHWWINGKNEVILDDKMIGVKYHGGYMKKPITSINPRHLEELDKRKAVLMVHCGRYLEGDIKSNTSYLHALEVARNYPNIKVIMSHMGGTDTTVCKKAIDHAASLYNVYFDTSGITTPYIIEYAVNKLPITRILFGSDMPWCSFNAMIWTVSDAMITRLEKEDIYYNNFEVFLK